MLGFKAFAAFAIPLGSSGHGVALHTAFTQEEVQAAAQHALDLVNSSVSHCGGEVTSCQKLSSTAQMGCLFEHFDQLTHDCQLQMVNVARHLPHTKLAPSEILDTPLALSATDSNLEVEVKDFGNKTNKGCNVTSDALPYVWSYHIHFMWNELTDSSTKALQLALHNKFVAEFAPNIKYCKRFSFLTDLWNKDSVVGPEGHEFAEPCMFPQLPPGGPFFLWERGYLISATTFHKVMPWLAANRPLGHKGNPNPIGILIHPNSGCQYNDLNHWSMWAGLSKPLFYDILKGCVWAGCEDHVLGCIAFNHLPKDEGYGQCYKAPSALSDNCVMSIEPTSNTSTMDCQKSEHSVTTVV